MKPTYYLDIPENALIGVKIVHDKTELNTRSFSDRRKRVNRFIFTVDYMGVEFRKSVEVPVFVNYDTLNAPSNRIGSSRFVYECLRIDFDEFLRQYMNA